MENVDAVLEDIDRYIGLTEEEYSGKGKYIFGFSMGGMFANMMTIKKKNYFNGNIMIAPPFLFESSALVKWESVIRFLAKVCPSWKLIPNLGKFSSNF